MNYAGRFNSFIFKGRDVFDAIEVYKNTEGITHLEFNYPEHIVGYDLEELKKAISPLKSPVTRPPNTSVGKWIPTYSLEKAIRAARISARTP